MTKIYVIAEMAYSHDGSITLAERIISSAAKAGADAISIHFTHMPDYMVPHYGAGPGRVSEGKDTQPIYDYLCNISPNFEEWSKVVDFARKQKLDIIIMPNDWTSFKFAETLAPTAYVLSAACFEERDFIAAVGSAGRPVYLRIGGATLGEMEMVIDILRRSDNEQITLLYGHQNYPTKIQDTNLKLLTCLMDTFGLPVGIADHIDADQDFASIAPLLAIPLGISCIEKHITHDRAVKGEDFESALNESEFTLLVHRIRETEVALGLSHARGLDDSSALYRKNVRKRLVAARDIQAGQILERADLAAKRADEGLSPLQIDAFVGHTADIDIAMNTGLQLSMVKSQS